MDFFTPLMRAFPIFQIRPFKFLIKDTSIIAKVLDNEVYGQIKVQVIIDQTLKPIILC